MKQIKLFTGPHLESVEMNVNDFLSTIRTVYDVKIINNTERGYIPSVLIMVVYAK